MRLSLCDWHARGRVICIHILVSHVNGLISYHLVKFTCVLIPVLCGCSLLCFINTSLLFCEVVDLCEDFFQSFFFFALHGFIFNADGWIAQSKTPSCKCYGEKGEHKKQHTTLVSPSMQVRQHWSQIVCLYSEISSHQCYQPYHLHIFSWCYYAH